MAAPSSIVCYGNDSMLLRTRQQILQHAGFLSQTAQNRQELERCFEDLTVDVLIICHSVSHEECEAAKKLALSQAVPAEILILDKGRQKCDLDGVDAILDSRDGPVAFLKTIHALRDKHLGDHRPNKGSRPAAAVQGATGTPTGASAGSTEPRDLEAARFI